MAPRLSCASREDEHDTPAVLASVQTRLPSGVLLVSKAATGVAAKDALQCFAGLENLGE